MSHARRILITGAAKGLGRAMAEHLAAPGCELLLHHRPGVAAQGPAAAVAAAVRERGARVVLLPADLADPSQRTDLAEQVTGGGPLHVLIHNASVYHPGPLLESAPEEWSETLEVNCAAIHHLTTLLVPTLEAGAPARVILLGDSGNDRVRARTEAVAYHISKLGVNVLTRSFAQALTPRGITVNQLSPGILENSIDGPERPIPAGRAGTFADVLAALDYLLSPEAEYVSGANLVISGGWNL